MNNVKKSVTLVYNNARDKYRVKKLVNILTPHVGTYLTEKEVRDLQIDFAPIRDKFELVVVEK